jgi:hypothetical protein
MPDDDQDWVRGPARHGRGPIPSAYIPGTLERDCPNCAAPHGQYCVHKGTGVLRRSPCPQRLPHNPDPEVDQ